MIAPLRCRPARFRRVVPSLTTLTLVVAATLFGPVTAARATEVYPAVSSGTWTVDGHGFGHGHGMSQYGAQGAAIAGLTYAQIMAFYYQGTALSSSTAVTLRVGLTGSTSAVTVDYKTGLRLIYGSTTYTLPTGSSKWRLVPSGTTLALQKFNGSTWAADRAIPAATADFSGGSATATVRYERSASVKVDYRGTVGAARSGSSLLPINRVAMEDYLRGVVPREMPAAWQPEAVKSQAVAARTYARYARDHNGADAFDICDTTQCQVYQGEAQYDGSGTATGIHSEPAANTAIAATAGKVVTYGGAPIFSQFSAADGGWTVDGGQPYLKARSDPYEVRANGPYYSWTRQVTIADVASAYGLRSITELDITGRDGNGDWGGRVTTAVVKGIRPDGSAASISVSGIGLASAMGLPHHWFRIQNLPPGAPTNVTATPDDHSVLVAWSPPATSGSSPITNYAIGVVGRTARQSVPATARSFWVTGLDNDRNYTIYLSAISASGEGPKVTVNAVPTARRDPVTPVNPLVLFDTTKGTSGPVTPSKPIVFGVPGHGSFPGSARSVTLTVTVIKPTNNGVLSVQPYQAPSVTPAAIAYRAGQNTTATVVVSLIPTSKVVFRPSVGSANLLVMQSAFTSSSGAKVSTTAPATLARMSLLPTAVGRLVQVRGVGPVPAGATGVVLQVTGGGSSGAQSVRVWPDGATDPNAGQISISAGSSRSNVIVLPLLSSGAVRFAASATGVGADATVLGYLAPAGAANPGDPIGNQVTLLATRVAPSPVTINAIGLSVRVDNHPGIPAGAAQAVWLHITVSDASAAGALRVTARGAAQPQAASMRYTTGGTFSAMVLSRLDSTGSIRAVTDGASVHAVIELVGYATAS